jgi:RNA polymerase sigma-70 factor (ECF subfamily)
MQGKAADIGDTLAATLSRAADGDEAALARIIEAHHADMTRVCFVVCGDIDTAKEAVQAAWAIAWRKLGSLHDVAQLRPWLVSIAVNEARQIVRRDRRRRIVEVAAVDEEPVGGGDPAARAGDLDLANVLSGLDPEDRALLALRYVAGFNSFELGRAVGKSASWTRVRLARLLGRLRSELGDE